MSAHRLVGVGHEAGDERAGGGVEGGQVGPGGAVDAGERAAAEDDAGSTPVPPAVSDGATARAGMAAFGSQPSTAPAPVVDTEPR